MSQDPFPFFTIPEPPAALGAGAILGRLVDGIGFRFRWASEGIRDPDLPFKPAPDCMSLGEIIEHIHELLAWVAKYVGVSPLKQPAEPAGFALMRGQILDLATALSARFKGMSEKDLAQCSIASSRGDTLPLWNMVNGPLSDSLTHIGQVLSWRRIAGSPPAAADVFRGRPPKGV